MKQADGAKEGRYSIARHAWPGGGKIAAPRDLFRKSGTPGVRPPFSFAPIGLFRLL